MESHKQPTIDVAGTILNMKNSGFNHLNRICELIENSISAGAKRIRFTINKKTHVITYIDDACGMDKQGLIDYGTLNKRTNATNTSHGCYGIGGKHSLTGLTNNGNVHIVSKPMNNSGIWEIEISYEEAIKTSSYLLIAHKASKEADEKWHLLAFNPNSSGTVQTMYSNKSIVNELSDRISTNDITKDSIRFELGCIYNKNIRDGLVIELVVDDTVYIVNPFDRLMFDRIDPTYKEEVIIETYKYGLSSYRFYYRDSADISHYRDCSSSKRGKGVKDTPPVELIKSDALDVKRVGTITIKSTYSKEWEKYQKPDLLIMGFKNKDSNTIKPAEKDMLGGTVYERNNKQISHFPTKSDIHKDHTTQRYINDSHHLISFEACDDMDDIFKVLINKSKLVEENINKDLCGTILHICENFANKMKKINDIPESSSLIIPSIPSPITTPTAFGATPSLLPVVKQSAVVVTKKPAAAVKQPAVVAVANQPAAVTVPKKPEAAVAVAVAKKPVVAVKQPAAIVENPLELAHKEPSNVVIQLNQPKTLIVPIPKPAMNIEFSKTDTHLLIIHQKNELKIKIPYIGQYSTTEKLHNEYLMKLGEERFMEWIIGRSKLGLYDHDSKYFN